MALAGPRRPVPHKTALERAHGTRHVQQVGRIAKAENGDGRQGPFGPGKIAPLQALVGQRQGLLQDGIDAQKGQPAPLSRCRPV